MKINTLDKDSKPFLDKLMHQAEVDRRKDNQPSFMHEPQSLHKRGKSLMHGEFKIKKTNIHKNIRNLKGLSLKNNKKMSKFKNADIMQSMNNLKLPKLGRDMSEVNLD